MAGPLAAKFKQKARRGLAAWAAKFNRYPGLKQPTEDLYRGPHRIETFEPVYRGDGPNIEAMCNAVRLQLMATPFQSLPPTFNGALMHILESHDNLVNQVSQLTSIDEQTASEPEIDQLSLTTAPQAVPQVASTASDRDLSAALPQDPSEEADSNGWSYVSLSTNPADGDLVIEENPPVENGADSHKHQNRFSFEPGDDADVFLLRQRQGPDQTHLSHSGYETDDTKVNSSVPSNQDHVASSASTAPSIQYPPVFSPSPPPIQPTRKPPSIPKSARHPTRKPPSIPKPKTLSNLPPLLTTWSAPSWQHPNLLSSGPRVTNTPSYPSWTAPPGYQSESSKATPRLGPSPQRLTVEDIVSRETGSPSATRANENYDYEKARMEARMKKMNR